VIFRDTQFCIFAFKDAHNNVNDTQFVLYYMLKIVYVMIAHNCCTQYSTKQDNLLPNPPRVI